MRVFAERLISFPQWVSIIYKIKFNNTRSTNERFYWSFDTEIAFYNQILHTKKRHDFAIRKRDIFMDVNDVICIFNPLVVYLRNEFHFSEVSVNYIGSRAKWMNPVHVNFASDQM